MVGRTYLTLVMASALLTHYIYGHSATWLFRALGFCLNCTSPFFFRTSCYYPLQHYYMTHLQLPSGTFFVARYLSHNVVVRSRVLRMQCVARNDTDRGRR